MYEMAIGVYESRFSDETRRPIPASEGKRGVSIDSVQIHRGDFIGCQAVFRTETVRDRPLQLPDRAKSRLQLRLTQIPSSTGPSVGTRNVIRLWDTVCIKL